MTAVIWVSAKVLGTSLVNVTGLLCSHCDLQKLASTTREGTSSCSGHVKLGGTLWLWDQGNIYEVDLEGLVGCRAAEMRGKDCRQGHLAKLPHAKQQGTGCFPPQCSRN